jgi:hypothetical protein
MSSSFQDTQLRFTRYLRDPDAQVFNELPQERMQVYSELIYNNIENFLASAFPVIRSIIADEKWHGLVRDFIRDHSAQTPYFLEISQEFLTYLLQTNHSLVSEYPFLTALAHYEWVELALDITDEDLPPKNLIPKDLWGASVCLSPLSQLLAYPWPVHKISADFLPMEELEAHLLVYRPISSRFLHLCRDNPQTLLQQMNSLVKEGADEHQLRSQLPSLLIQLHEADVVLFQ